MEPNLIFIELIPNVVTGSLRNTVSPNKFSRKLSIFSQSLVIPYYTSTQERKKTKPKTKQQMPHSQLFPTSKVIQQF